jgi:hypothetical protein
MRCEREYSIETARFAERDRSARDCGRRQGQAAFGRRCAPLDPVLVASVWQLRDAAHRDGYRSVLDSRSHFILGNAHLRRVLVEAAWQYRHHAFRGPALTNRQRGAPTVAIDIAWRAQRRLHRRYRVLAARNKPKPLIVTAVARELTGFLWAALTQ